MPRGLDVHYIQATSHPGINFSAKPRTERQMLGRQESTGRSEISGFLHITE